MTGKLVIVSGPSGAGKSTIVKELLQHDAFNLHFSVSACSRPKREGEVEGKDYYFMSVDAFKNSIDEKEFLEWEEVYPNQYYGTLLSEVEKIRQLERNVIFDVDVMGALSIKREYQENALALFVEPPSIDELESRLRLRKTETEATIAKRLRRANMEMRYARRFDQIISNDNLQHAIAAAKDAIKTFLASE
jgi:guanylate kinase